MPIGHRNWLSERGVGIITDLQATPLTSGNYYANPKKSKGSATSTHARSIAPLWPGYDVRKRRNSTTILTNALTLETTTTNKFTYVNSFDTTYGIIPSNIGGFTTCYVSDAWDGGDDNIYPSADYILNVASATPGKYDIYRYSVSLENDGVYSYTSSVDYAEIVPDTTGNANIYNGAFGIDPSYEAYATFNGSPLSAYDIMDSYTLLSGFPGSTGTPGATKGMVFLPRMSTDGAHGLKTFVDAQYDSDDSLIKNYPFTSSDSAYGFMSYRHSASDLALGLNQDISTSCQFYYTPSADPLFPCDTDDCWYAGKTVTIDITYKQAQVTFTYDYPPSYESGEVAGLVNGEKYPTLGTWSTHSVATKTLTLPSGITRQTVGASFSIPRVAGYVVAIDDIKLVSIT